MLPRILPKCRLCLKPVTGAGVHLAQVDDIKFFLWCYRNCKSENPQVIIESLKDAWCCDCCVFNARLQHEEVGGNRHLRWWPKDSESYKKYKYFKEELFKPCCVVSLTRLTEDELKLHLNHEVHDTLNQMDLDETPPSPLSEIAENEIKEEPMEDLVDDDQEVTALCGILRKQPIAEVKTEPEDNETVITQPLFKFKCLLCNGKFQRRKSCLMHLRKVHSAEVHSCRRGNCLYVFSSQFELIQHEKFVHHITPIHSACRKGVIIVPPPCPLAVKLINSGQRISCNFCTKSFKSQKGLTQHINRIHNKKNEGVFRCRKRKDCTQFFETKEKVDRHIKEMHSNCFECDFCKGLYASKMALVFHISKKHTELPKETTKVSQSFALKKKQCEPQEVDILSGKRLQSPTVRSKDSLSGLGRKKGKKPAAEAGMTSKDLQTKKKCARKLFGDLPEIKKPKKSQPGTCGKDEGGIAALNSHIRNVHPEKLLTCAHRGCDSTFAQESARLNHILNAKHLSGK